MDKPTLTSWAGLGVLGVPGVCLGMARYTRCARYTWHSLASRPSPGCSLPQVSVEGEHHEKAVELLKAAPASVKLVVRYTPKVRSHGHYEPRKS